MSGAAPAAPQVPHHDAELQDLRRQLNYRNAEATNLRTNLAAVQSELAAAKIAAARGAVGGGGRQDGEASRLRREILQLRTKLEFAEQARREMQHAPAAVQAPQRRTTAAQTDAEQLGALPVLPSPVCHHFGSASHGVGPCRFAAKYAQLWGLRLRLQLPPSQPSIAHPSNRAQHKVSRARSVSASLVVRMKSGNSGWDSVRATWLDQLVIATSSIRCYLPPGLQYTRERGPLMTSHSSLLSPYAEKHTPLPQAAGRPLRCISGAPQAWRQRNGRRRIWVVRWYCSTSCLHRGA